VKPQRRCHVVIVPGCDVVGGGAGPVVGNAKREGERAPLACLVGEFEIPLIVPILAEVDQTGLLLQNQGRTEGMGLGAVLRQRAKE
jgi:hypothetical protein